MSEPKYISDFDRPADALVLTALEQALRTLEANKPNDRSKKDRAYAIVKTDLEKATACFKEAVVTKK